MNVEDCQNGHVYRIRSRNLSIGVYRSTDDSFVGIREKFGSRFLDREYATECFGTVKSIGEDLGVCPTENLQTSLGTECGNCRARMNYVYHPKGHTEKFHGKWVHVDKPDCGKLEPVSIHNKILFDFLDTIDKMADERD